MKKYILLFSLLAFSILSKANFAQISQITTTEGLSSQNVSIMEKDKQKTHRRIAKINGVKIVNAENSKKQQERPQKDATAGTRNLVWLMDKDNLEL